VTIPEKSWSRFRDIFSDYVDKMKDGGSATGGGATAATPTSSSVAADNSPGPSSGSHKSLYNFYIMKINSFQILELFLK
jgi:hypothetical protein